MTYIFLVVLSLFIVLITSLIAFSAVKNFITRTIFVILFALFIPLTFMNGFQLLGQPRPVQFDFLIKQKFVIISFYFKENEAIWLWVVNADQQMSEPIYYKLNWDLKTALQIQKAMREAAATGNQVFFDPTRDGGGASDNSQEDRQGPIYLVPNGGLPDKKYQ